MARKPYQVPRWARALLAADRVASRVASWREAMRDELLLAFIPPEHRSALTAAMYENQHTYRPGGQHFSRGLFSWEARFVESPRFPRKGRILIGAAGAGREMVALLDRGYSVTAFDPCASFIESAAPLVRDKPAKLLCGSYEDLMRATEGERSPLTSLLEEPPFDAVILGWGSLSHVLPSSSRRSLLRALKLVAPNAPVLASFVLRTEDAMGTESKGRARDALRTLFTLLGAPGTSEVGDYFYLNTGFFSYLTSEELSRIAFEAGYEVVTFDESPYPHAVLQPLQLRDEGRPS